jgi:hypothetical protein
MKAYIDQLKADVAEANLRREDAKSKTHNADTRILCDTPLVDQIEDLMRSLPPAQRNRPWSMDEFIARLQGRFSARPHPMNVGQALRASGWQQRRDWTREGGGRRVWHIGET